MSIRAIRFIVSVSEECVGGMQSEIEAELSFGSILMKWIGAEMIIKTPKASCFCDHCSSLFVAHTNLG